MALLVTSKVLSFSPTSVRGPFSYARMRVARRSKRCMFPLSGSHSLSDGLGVRT